MLTKLQKVSTHNLANDIKNYQEVVNFIQATKYHHFLGK